MKVVDFDVVLAKALKNKATKREWDKLVAKHEKELEKLHNEQVAQAIASEVVTLRKAKGWSQKQLAEKIGTSQPAIAKLESGTYSRFSFPLIRRIAIALDAVPEVHLRKLVQP